MKTVQVFIKTLHAFFIEWRNDIFAGISFSSLATYYKYVFDHFIDIGWTVAAAICVMIATHYGKKLLILIDEKIKNLFK